MKIKLLFLFFVITQLTIAQINENFDGTITGWSFSGASAAIGQQCSGTKSISYISNGNFAITPSITNPDKLNFNIKRSNSATPVMSIDVQISDVSPASQTSGPWTTVTTIGSTVLSTCTAITQIDLSIYTGLRYVKFLDSRASGAQQRGIDDVSITQVVAGSAPVVTAATRTGTVGTAFNYNVIATNSPTGYALASGTLPAGLNLNTTTGLISGTPTVNGSFTANITATNGSGTSTASAINFTINAATSVCVTQGFGLGTTAPSEWVFTGISGTYTVASNYGLASPSLSFDTTNDVITTEVLSAGNAASQLSFWIKGQGINSGSTSTFVIDGFDGTSWTNIDIINSTALIASSGSAVIKTYNSGS
ncbi:MAG: putative Ig domain-containing protein, partial [Flavobacterium sp.]|nr:putative Ig domain-containing protein [Flavobacterium sp.]